VIHVRSAQRTLSRRVFGERGSAEVRQIKEPRTALAVASIGYLVPRTPFNGRVHSVFARACNLACGDALLTVCAKADGPTTLRLARGAPTDLRDLFEVGERFDCHDQRVRTSSVELCLLHATVWRPAKRGARLPPARIEAHLRDARATLDQRRAMHRNVLDGEGAPSAMALRDACHALDSERAARHADRLVGWGEGLTPAGDDFLIGLIAGLAALTGTDDRRRRFHASLAATLRSSTRRTTPIAAHCLRLAAEGHHDEPLIRVRDALLCEDDWQVVDTALRSALDVGATSGSDTVSGLLAGLVAWLPAPGGTEDCVKPPRRCPTASKARGAETLA
jgi:hypothetical protein